MRSVLTTSGGTPDSWVFEVETDREAVRTAVGEGRLDGALFATRDASGRLDFTFITGQGLGADRTQFVAIGTFAVAFLEWTERVQPSGAVPFLPPPRGLRLTARGLYVARPDPLLVQGELAWR